MSQAPEVEERRGAPQAKPRVHVRVPWPDKRLKEIAVQASIHTACVQLSIKRYTSGASVVPTDMKARGQFCGGHTPCVWYVWARVQSQVRVLPCACVADAQDKDKSNEQCQQIRLITILSCSMPVLLTDSRKLAAQRFF